MKNQTKYLVSLQRTKQLNELLKSAQLTRVENNYVTVVVKQIKYKQLFGFHR